MQRWLIFPGGMVARPGSLAGPLGSLLWALGAGPGAIDLLHLLHRALSMAWDGPSAGNKIYLPALYCCTFAGPATLRHGEALSEHRDRRRRSWWADA